MSYSYFENILVQEPVGICGVGIRVDRWEYENGTTN